MLKKYGLTIYRLVLLCVLLVWMARIPVAQGQGRTSVRLDSIGDQELRKAAEKSASVVITEFNRAETYEWRPSLMSLPVTEQGRNAIRSHWKEAQFFCNRTTLVRRLVQRDGGIYEIRDIPLIVGGQERRNGILTVNSKGEVIGFRYSNEPATGTLTIVSEPSEAIVESPIGANVTQKTPIQFENVPRGDHNFTIKKEGYHPVDTTLTVQAYHSTRDTIQLTPTFGFLRVKASPEVIHVDGIERFPSEEGRIQVDAGKHVVTLSRQYHQTYDTTLTVAPGHTEVISTELQRKRTPLRVFSDPSGATVIIDGDTAGTTPLVTTREAGRAYALRVDALSHVPSKRMKIFVEADTIVRKEVALSPVNMQAKGEDVRIDNVRAERSSGLVTITYDLFGKSDEAYEVMLSVTGQDGEPIEIGSEAVRGAIGEDITPGRDKKVYWRRDLPEGASLQLTQGSPSVATSLTVGYFTTDFQLNGNGSDTPYNFNRPLKTIMFTGRTGSFSVGYDNFSSSQGNHWALNVSSKVGGNVHMFRPSKSYIFLLYIPIRVQGNYIYTDPYFDVDMDKGSQNILNIGIGSGFGSRLRVGRFSGIRKYSVLNGIVMEGSIMFAPSGYFNLNQKGFKKAHLSRTREISLEIKIVDLIDTGVGRGLGITFGFTHRVLRRTSERPANVGEIFQSAFRSERLKRISTQRLFRIGINWQ